MINSKAAGVSCAFLLLVACFGALAGASGNDKFTAKLKARNPVIWADVPDPSVLRVGDTWYMSSTSMHMNPGVPIMKSKNLVDWTLIGYAYATLADGDRMNLANKQNEYGRGSWASSLRYHNNYFYVSTFSHSSGETYIFRTADIEAGAWQKFTLDRVYHDSSLFFDDGRAFLIYGVDDIHILELTADATAIKAGGLDQLLIKNTSALAGSDFIVPAEGSQIQKIKGKYYLSLISWPKNGMRMQLLYRADKLMGPYEGRIVLQDRGIAQGSYIDTPEGDWFAMLFRDFGAVGRTPYLIPVVWQDAWPILGTEGKAPDVLDFGANMEGVSAINASGIVASDEFSESVLKNVWQWNHNPNNDYWSLTERKGFLRLTNDRVDEDFVSTRNTLTQRTFGPHCSATIGIDVSGMKDGDVAGFGALQKNFAYLAVKKTGAKTTVVNVNAGDGNAREFGNVDLEKDIVYFRIEMDFHELKDTAWFAYSFDGVSWEVLGEPLKMTYTLPHFMGYRFALFNYASKTSGGYVDFDFFRVSGELSASLN